MARNHAESRSSFCGHKVEFRLRAHMQISRMLCKDAQPIFNLNFFFFFKIKINIHIFNSKLIRKIARRITELKSYPSLILLSRFFLEILKDSMEKLPALVTLMIVTTITNNEIKVDFCSILLVVITKTVGELCKKKISSPFLHLSREKDNN